MSDVDVPVLVLRGTEDRLIDPETALRLAGGIRGAEVALVEGGGHCCPHTMPAETNRLIIGVAGAERPLVHRTGTAG